MSEVKAGHDYTKDAEKESGVGVMQNSGIGMWRWSAGIMASLIMLLVGAFIGDFAASVRYASLTTKMDQHTLLVGHPVMVQRVSDMQSDLEEIKEQQKDDSVVLNEIYRSLP